MNYDSLISAIRDTHRHAQAGAAGAVNRHLLLRNWLIGAYIIEFEQNGEDRARYGEGLLKQLAGDLTAREINGCSRQMLERMRLFYSEYPQFSGLIGSPAVSIFGEGASSDEKSPPAVSFFKTLSVQTDQSMPGRPSTAKTPPPPADKIPLPPQMLLRLSWTHIIELLGLDDPWKRAFYEGEFLKWNWSKRQLQRLIEENSAAWRQNHMTEADSD